jgi:hypothetical protein
LSVVERLAEAQGSFLVDDVGRYAGLAVTEGSKHLVSLSGRILALEALGIFSVCDIEVGLQISLENTGKAGSTTIDVTE